MAPITILTMNHIAFFARSSRGRKIEFVSPIYNKIHVKGCKYNRFCFALFSGDFLYINFFTLGTSISFLILLLCISNHFHFAKRIYKTVLTIFEIMEMA
jgi:hypothetical protein